MTQESLVAENGTKEERFEWLHKELNQINSLDERLSRALEWMSSALTEELRPNFSLFWESQKLSLQLLKQELPFHAREHFSMRYKELIDQAHGLRKIYEEQSSFLVTEIEAAFQTVEEGLNQVASGQLPSKQWPYPSHPEFQSREENYNKTQSQLDFLNAKAEQLNALRKEITEASILPRQKYRLFKKLSAIGDQIFPKRRELIKEISLWFKEDVERLTSNLGQELGQKGALFNARESIKEIQQFARHLTMNTEAFRITRELLSQSWELIKEQDKMRHDDWSKRREESQKKESLLREKITLLSKNCESHAIGLEESLSELDLLTEEVKESSLLIDERKALQRELNQLQKMIRERKKEEEQKQKAKETELESKRAELFSLLKEKIAKFNEELSEHNCQDPSFTLSEIEREINKEILKTEEKQNLFFLLDPIKDQILDLEGEILLAEVKKGEKSVESLYVFLQQKRKRRQEIGEQCETLRKAKGGMSVGFEQAMQKEQQFQTQKQRLEKIDTQIDAVEEIISSYDEGR